MFNSTRPRLKPGCRGSRAILPPHESRVWERPGSSWFYLNRQKCKVDAAVARGSAPNLNRQFSRNRLARRPWFKLIRTGSKTLKIGLCPGVFKSVACRNWQDCSQDRKL